MDQYSNSSLYQWPVADASPQDAPSMMTTPWPTMLEYTRQPSSSSTTTTSDALYQLYMPLSGKPPSRRAAATNDFATPNNLATPPSLFFDLPPPSSWTADATRHLAAPSLSVQQQANCDRSFFAHQSNQQATVSTSTDIIIPRDSYHFHSNNSNGNSYVSQQQQQQTSSLLFQNQLGFCNQAQTMSAREQTENWNVHDQGPKQLKAASSHISRGQLSSRDGGKILPPLESIIERSGRQSNYSSTAATAGSCASQILRQQPPATRPVRAWQPEICPRPNKRRNIGSQPYHTNVDDSYLQTAKRPCKKHKKHEMHRDLPRKDALLKIMGIWPGLSTQRAMHNKEVQIRYGVQGDSAHSVISKEVNKAITSRWGHFVCVEFRRRTKSSKGADAAHPATVLEQVLLDYGVVSDDW